MRQRILNPVFALLIFVAHLNCVVEHQLIGNPSGIISTSSIETPKLPPGDSAPVDSETCEHGCICHGATLAPSIAFEEFQVESFFVQLLTLHPFQYQLEDLDPGSGFITSIAQGGSLLRALDRCALLQTFLI